MQSPSSKTSLVVAAVACLALLGALILGAEAEGKKKKGGYRAVGATQSAILDSGKIVLRGKGTGKAAVRATAGSAVLAKVAGFRAGNGKRQAKLNKKGRTLLAGCTVDGLSVRTLVNRSGKGSKVARVRYTQLDRDLGICSTGSENPTARPYLGDPVPVANADRCDFLDPAVCLQPWPNDYFTIADPGTDTGRRLDIDQASMPRNKNNVPIDVSDYLRADGYSPGNLIVVKVPQVQTQAAFDASGIVGIDDLRRYDDDDQPVVVIDADSGERQPIWAEVDANPLQPPIPGVTSGGSGTAADSNLIIRPARNLEEGHRYIVAIRGLKDASGAPVGPPLPFRVYRDRLITDQPEVEGRRAHIEDLISTLQDNGFARSNLYMTWDFTVASEQSLSRRALAMRDDALLRLGDSAPGDPIDGAGDSTPGDGIMQGDAPSFTITATSDPDGPGGRVLRQVEGELTNVPCYLDAPGCPPVQSDLVFNPGDDDPVIAPTSFADDDPPATGAAGVRFRCIIPESVVDGAEVDPAQPGTYGHGLLGLYTQVGGQARLGNDQNSVWCATNWAGFSEDDIVGIAGSLIDLSNFRQLVDRMQQGFVNFLYLGRAMAHPDGLNTDPAFQVDADGSTTLDPDEQVIDTASGLFYEGISQGAIMGGALTALSPDIQRSVLNVNGMNYSTLLRRSVDFDEYAELAGVGLYANYPNQLERPLILSLMQLLWDRGEANGYAHHMTGDPLPNTPPHEVLLQAAAHDHQVSNITAEVEARTIGAPIYKPALDPGRHWERNPFMGLPGIDFGPNDDQPYGGSALVYYDGGPETYFNDGTASPQAQLECENDLNDPLPLAEPCQGSKVIPLAELPPRPQLGYGEDPHGYPRRSVDALTHVIDWLRPGGGFLPCLDGPDPRPCYANGWTGP